MAVNAVFPTLSSTIQPNPTGVQADQAKNAAQTGEKTQTQNAVDPAGDAEGNFDNGLTAGNKEGRGQLVDVKV